MYFCTHNFIKIERIMSEQGIEPKRVKKWITIVIAILSAIAGALGESQSNVTASLLGL